MLLKYLQWDATISVQAGAKGGAKGHAIVAKEHAQIHVKPAVIIHVMTNVIHTVQVAVTVASTVAVEDVRVAIASVRVLVNGHAVVVVKIPAADIRIVILRPYILFCLVIFSQ